MLKQLRVAFFGAVLAFTGTAAQAQYSLTVNAPATVAGVVSPTYGVDETWGFDPLTVAPATGFCQMARPDTLAQTQAGVGDLTGKIAVVYRGVAEFGVKALNCQRAGAIGVIVVNDNRAPVPMSAASQGANVTIPVIKVSNAWGAQMKDLINSGTLNVTIGNLRGLYTNNLRLQFYNLLAPDHYAIPSFLVAAQGDLRFQIGGFVNNFGSAAAPAVKFNAQVRRVSPNPAVLYRDSIEYANGIAVNDSTVGDLMTPFDLVVADPNTTDRRGHYQVVYTATAAGVTDGNPTDNEKVFDFYLTDNSYSKAKLVTDGTAPYFQPAYNIGITVSGGGSLSWGHYHRTGTVGGWANQMTFAVTINDTDSSINSLVGETFDVQVAEWTDTDNDSLIGDTEVEVLGIGSRTYTSNRERAQFFTLPIQDVVTGDDGVQLLPNRRYLYLVNYAGTKQVFIASSQNEILYEINESVAENKDKFIVLFNGTNWGRFAESPQTAIRVNLGQSQTDTARPTSVKRNLGSLTQIGLVPNPAKDRVQVSVADNIGTGFAVITVSDLSGHVVLTERRALQGARSTYFLSTSALPAGIYQVGVSTGRGTMSKKLVITK